MKKNLPLIIHIFYILIAATFCFLYYKKIVAGVDPDAPNSINAVLSFSTMKPYQFRLLVPFIFKIFSVFSFIPAKAIYMLLNCAAVYLTIWLYHKFLRLYFGNNPVNIFLAPLIIFPMFWNYILLNESFQYYDFFSVLLFLAGLYFIVKENFKLLIICFVIGLLNKETAVYLIFAYLLFNYKSAFTLKILANTGILVVTFLVIKILLAYIFRNNPGDVFEVGLYVNVDILKNILKNRIYAKNLALSFGGLYLFGLLYFLSGRWKKFPDRRYVFIHLAIIPYIIIGIVVIYFTEVRVYAELIPMITTLFILYLSTFEKIRLIPLRS